MKHFLSCNNPVRVNTKHGITFVPCGHCIQCKVSKQQTISTMLQLESQKNIYCEFLTLTYDDNHLPYIDTSVMFPFGYRVILPNRVIKKYNRHSKEFYYVPDKDSEKFRLTDFSTLDTAPLLHDYFTRVDKYYERFPFRTRGIRDHDKVAILWYDDILKYIDRLRNFFKKVYNEKIRYYIVCEYGSQSLRPHYHILLFHNSFVAHRDFTVTVKLHGHCEKNPREVCNKLYLSRLWLYGDTTTKTTDGYMGGYVAGYLTQHSEFPRVLDRFPQRAFHSTLLGCRSRSEVRQLFETENWDILSSDVITTKRNEQRTVSVPSSTYAQFAVRFTSSAAFDCEQTYSLFRSATKYARLFFADKGGIYDDSEVRAFMLFILGNYDRYKRDYLFKPLYYYVYSVVKPIYNKEASVHSLKSLLYAAFKHYSLANILGLSSWVLLNKRFRLMSYLNYKKLVQHFTLLETDYNFAYQYYSVIDPLTGTYDLKRLFMSELFRRQQLDAAMEYDSNIKHRSVVDSYKN